MKQTKTVSMKYSYGNRVAPENNNSELFFRNLIIGNITENIMDKKKCCRCKKILPLSEFYKRESRPDGHMYRCKTCEKKRRYQRYVNGLSAEQIKTRDGNKKRKKLLKKGKYLCRKCNEIKHLTEFYNNSRNPHGYTYVCKDCIDKQYKKQYNKMKQNTGWVERKNERAKKNYHNNIEYYRKQKNKLRRKNRNKKKDDPKFKLNNSMRSGICRSLNGNKKGNHWEDIVGYTLGDLKKHLEKQFDKNMSWDNYGVYWHVDHIDPISSFNYTKPEHIGFKKCWELKNLQPLEAKENLSKSDKLIKSKQEYLVI